jgi:hypothetical protein
LASSVRIGGNRTTRRQDPSGPHLARDGWRLSRFSSNVQAPACPAPELVLQNTSLPDRHSVVWPQRHPGTVLFATQNVYTAQSSGAGGRAGGICRATGGSIRRYATSARISSSSQFEAWSQIMPCQWSVRPSGVIPLRMARAICSSVHAPIPVRMSLVRLRLHVSSGRVN